MKRDQPEKRDTLFLEQQRLRQKWIWLLVGIVAAIAWAAFIQQVVFGNPVGNRPTPNYVVWLIFILFGIGMPWLMYFIKLVTRLDSSHLTVRLRPLLTRKIPLKEIASFEARTYRPLREFGGWGLRFSPRYGRAYNMHGNRGVQLILSNDDKILVGSQHADELAEALRKSMRRS